MSILVLHTQWCLMAHVCSGVCSDLTNEITNILLCESNDMFDWVCCASTHIHIHNSLVLPSNFRNILKNRNKNFTKCEKNRHETRSEFNFSTFLTPSFCDIAKLFFKHLGKTLSFCCEFIFLLFVIFPTCTTAQNNRMNEKREKNDSSQWEIASKNLLIFFLSVENFC